LLINLYDETWFIISKEMTFFLFEKLKNGNFNKVVKLMEGDRMSSVLILFVWTSNLSFESSSSWTA